MTTTERLFDLSLAFDHPVTRGAVLAIVVGLFTASLLVRLFYKTEKIGEASYLELRSRIRSWYLLVGVMIVPILLGAAAVCLFFLALGLLCFKEYAQATGLKESRQASLSVGFAILVMYFAILDHWMGLFTTSWTLGICLIAVVALLPDQPSGYLKRVALAIVGFMLFGVSLGHLAFISNDVLFRPLLIWILLCLELNDIFAFLSGKAFGKRKLLPNTSPNKTWAGALGALLLTTLLTIGIGRSLFKETPLEAFPHLLALGLILSMLGQCGDLVISSIKRDLGIKDMASVIPGHGGLLDRFDSLLIAAPTIFHYLNYFLEGGIGAGQPVRILSGG